VSAWGFTSGYPSPSRLEYLYLPSSCSFPMERTWRRWWRKENVCACLSLCISSPGPMRLSRLRVKAVFGSPTCPEPGRRLIHMEPHTAVCYCRELRVDIRPFLDPWRRSPLLLCFRPRNLVQTYNRSYGCWIVFALFIAVRHPEMPHTVTDLTVLHNRYLPIMFLIWINFFIWSFCEALPMVPQRCHTHETSSVVMR
jgi:hypothetical protein